MLCLWSTIYFTYYIVYSIYIIILYRYNHIILITCIYSIVILHICCIDAYSCVYTCMLYIYTCIHACRISPPNITYPQPRTPIHAWIQYTSAGCFLSKYIYGMCIIYHIDHTDKILYDYIHTYYTYIYDIYIYIYIYSIYNTSKHNIYHI